MDRVVAVDTTIVRDFFAADGPLSQVFDEYKPRPQQIEYAESIFASVKTGRPLVIQAPTGIGKSFGYIVGSFLAGGKVIVSTATKALQSQLIDKDLKALKQAFQILGMEFEYGVLMGRSNFACLKRVPVPGDEGVDGQMEFSLEKFKPTPLQRWAIAGVNFNEPYHSDPATMNSGIKYDIPFDYDWQDWNEIAMDESCMGKRCSLYSACHYQRAWKHLAQCDVIVANHHLVGIDLTLPVNILYPTGWEGGKPICLVMDEAHKWPEILSSVTSTGIRWGQFSRLEEHHPEAVDLAFRLFNRIAEDFRGYMRRQQQSGEYVGQMTVSPDVEYDSKSLQSYLKNTANELWPRPDESPMTQDEMAVYMEANRLRNLADELRKVCSPTPRGFIRVIEIGTRAYQKDEKAPPAHRVELNLIQYDVSDLSRALADNAVHPDMSESQEESIFDDGIFTGMVPVFTSATLKANGNFDLSLSEMGMDGLADVKEMGHLFDYKNNGLIYHPQGLPSNKSVLHSDEFQERIAKDTLELARLTDGRILLLMTANKKMRIATQWLEDNVPSGWLVLSQSSGRDVQSLVSDYRVRNGENTILVGVSTMWQGLDLPGDLIMQMVVAGLPFPPITDPVFSARTADYEVIHGNRSAFRGLTLPTVSRALQQGFGRGFRRTEDRCVVTFYDPRITAGWASSLLYDLPPARQTKNLYDVYEFLGQSEKVGMFSDRGLV